MRLDWCIYDAVQTVSAEGLLVRLLHAPPLRGYFELSLHNATLRVSSATVNDDIYSELLVNLGSRLNDYRSTSGVVLKKNWGTPETRLRQRFLNNLGLHARTLIHVRNIPLY